MAEEKKIIIDEDWKAQVQAEKEAAKQPPGKPDAPKTEPAGAGAGAAEATAADFPMPPASLELLVTTLATEAMMALGQIPHPHTGQAGFHPQQAKYLIDMIEMLGEKTKGNASPGEAQLIEQLLHQLRMAYVELTLAREGQPGPKT